MRFKSFLLNEEKAYLGRKVGDVLTAVQDLEQDLGGLGVRQIARIADKVVDSIRKILHGQWSPRQVKYLKDLQKVAVSLKKAIEEKDDLKELVPQMTQALQDVSKKLGVKVNDLQATPQEEIPSADISAAMPPPQETPGQQPPPEMPQTGQQPPQMPQQPPMPGPPGGPPPQQQNM